MFCILAILMSILNDVYNDNKVTIVVLDTDGDKT